MTKAQIIDLQRRIGTTPDGFWGPLSIAACQRHLRSLMPTDGRWPGPHPRDVETHYGAPGTELVRITPPLPLHLYGDPETPVTKVAVHRLCAASLERVFADILTRHGDDTRIMRHALSFYGTYNDRPKRGGKSKSLHAYAAAIDLAADTNAFKASWPITATMPLEIMECFSREGWLSAGAFWGYDAMHFQATT
jgi:hypothetical protein